MAGRDLNYLEHKAKKVGIRFSLGDEGVVPVPYGVTGKKSAAAAVNVNFVHLVAIVTLLGL